LAASTSLFILNISHRYVEEHSAPLIEYTIILLLAIFFRRLLISSNSLRSAFLSVVGFSLNTYVLILIDSPAGAAHESSIKYYYLSTFSSGCRAFGIFQLFKILKTTKFPLIAQILETNAVLLETELNTLTVGLCFVLTGIFFKLGAYPGHLWVAEIYEGSSAPVRAFFRLPIKISVLAFFSSRLLTAFASISFL